MANLAVNPISTAGITPPTPDAADVAGDTFRNTGNEFVEVVNGSGAPVELTVAAVSQCNQGYTHDAVVAIPAGQTRVVGPFPVSRFGSNAAMTYDDVTTVTVTVLKA